MSYNPANGKFHSDIGEKMRNVLWSVFIVPPLFVMSAGWLLTDIVLRKFAR